MELLSSLDKRLQEQLFFLGLLHPTLDRMRCPAKPVVRFQMESDQDNPVTHMSQGTTLR